MAVTKDFKIRVAVEQTSDKEFKKMSSGSKNLEDAILRLEQSISALGPALEIAQKQIVAMGTGYAKTAEESSKFNQTLIAAVEPLQQQVSLYQQLGTAVQGSVSTFHDLLGIFQMVTDPENLKRLTGILTILSAMAHVRGYDKVADSLDFSIEKLKEFGKTSAEVTAKLTTNFNETVKKAEIVNSVFNNTGKVAGIAAASVAVFSLAKNYNAVGEAAKGAVDAFTFMNANQSSFATLAKENISWMQKSGKAFQMGFNGGKEAAAGASKSITQMGARFSTLFESVSLAGPAMVALGSIMSESEDTFTRVSGKVLVLAGLIQVSLVAGVVFVVEQLGDLSMALGRTLITSMEKFVAKAQEMQLAISNFQFTVKGFTRELGEGAVGSLDFWNKTMLQMQENTAFTTKEIMKSISFLVKEGTSLGLSVEENAAVLSRAADIAAASGEDLQAVTSAILNALSGNSQALFNMGIDIRDVALAHSEYIMMAGKNIDVLADLEKQQGRFQLLMKKSAGVVGAAANQLTTTAGAYAMVDKRVDILKQKLGAQGVVTEFLIRTQLKLTSTLLALPDAVTYVLGSLQDFAGAFLLIGGFILKYIFWILTLTNVYKFLKFAIAEYTVVQQALNLVFGLTASFLEVNVVAATSLGAVWTNLGIIARDLAVSFGGVLAIAFKNLWIATVRLYAILAPLLIKFAIIATVLYSLSEAYDRLTKSSALFARISESLNSVFSSSKDKIDQNQKSVGIFAKSWGYLVDVFKRVLVITTELATIFLVGLANAGQVVALVYLRVRQAFAGTAEETEAYKMAIVEVTKEIDQLHGQAISALTSIVSLGEGTAVAGEAAKDAAGNVKLLGGASSDTQAQIDLMVKNTLSLFNKQRETIKVAGTEFEKVLVKQTEAHIALEKAQSLNARGAEKAKAIAEATIEVYKAEIDIFKLRKDTMTDFNKQLSDFAIAKLKSDNDNIGAIKLEYIESRKLFEAQVTGLKAMAPLNKAQLEIINKIRKASTDAEASAVKAENLKKLKESIGSLTDDLKRMEEQTRAMRLEGEKRGMDAIDQSQLEYQSSLDLISTLEKQLKVLEQFDSRAQAITKGFREAAKAKADFAAIDAAKGELAKMNPVAAGVGGGAIKAGEGINAAIPAINTLFGREFQKMSGKAIAKFAVATGKFFQDFEGFIGGGAAAIGAAITGGAEILDESIGTHFGAGAEMIASSLGTIGSIMGGVVDYAAETLGVIFKAPELVNSFTGFLENIGNLPDDLMKAFSKLGEMINKLINNLPKMLSRFMNEFPKIIAKIVKELPKGLAMITDALPKIVQTIMKAIPSIIQALLDSISPSLVAVTDMVVMVIEAIPGLFTQIMDALPGVVQTLFEQIPRLFQAIFKAIPTIIENFHEHIDEFVLAFVEGFISAIGDIAASFVDEFLYSGGLERIIGSSLRAIPKIVIALVQGIARGLVKAIRTSMRMFERELVDVEMPESITKLPENIATAADKLGKKIAKEASQIFQVKDLETPMAGLATGKTPGELIQEAYKYGSKKTDDFIKLLKAAWDWVYKKTLAPWVKLLTAAWDLIDNNINKPLISSLKAVWELAKSILAANVLSFKTVWDGVKNFFSSILKGNVTEAFAGVFETFKNVGTQIWEGLKAGLAGGLDVFKGIGSSIWDSLRAGLAGLGTFFQDTLNAINPGSLLQKLFKFESGGKEAVENTLSKLTGTNIDVPFVSFAQGGNVPGNALVAGDSAMNDRILALLSPGEAVIPRSKMNDPFISSLIKAVLEGKIQPPKLYGGYAGKVAGDVGGAISKTGDVGGAISSVGGAISQAGKTAYSSGQDAAKAATEASKNAGGVASDEYKKAIKWLEQFDPQKLWDKLKEKGVASLGDMFLNADRFHSGGLVPAFSGGGEVPAILQPGEFVINRRSTQNNQGLLSSINAGRNGLAGGFGGNGGGGVNIQKIEINAKTMLDADQIRREVIPAIERDLKRKSLDGKFVLASTGVKAR